MVDIQAISVIIAAASVALAALNSILASRRTERNEQLTLETRQASLFMQLFSISDIREFIEDFGKIAYQFEYKNLEDWEEKYGPLVDLSKYSSWARVGRFFDGVGILVRKNLIDANLVTELLREIVINSWESMRIWVYEIRELMNTPEVWENFEYLYNEVKNRHPSTTTLDEQLLRVKDMVESERE